MDRRSFLGWLSAVGLANHLPISGAQVPDEQFVQDAWKALESEPATFNVNSAGTIFIPGMEEPTTRAECMDIDAWPSEEAEGLISFIGCYPRVEDVVVNSFLDAHEGYDGGRYGPSKAEWTAWLKSDPKIAEACSAEIVAWLEDTNLGDYDIEAAEIHSNTPQSAALSLWRERPEELEPFNVEIVEGSCPGSTYYAAVLRSSIKEANELAISLGLPIRFRHV